MAGGLRSVIIEVGARGFVPSHVHKAFSRLDIKAKALINKLVIFSQKCSYVIWINRFNKDFQAGGEVASVGVVGCKIKF